MATVKRDECFCSYLFNTAIINDYAGKSSIFGDRYMYCDFHCFATRIHGSSDNNSLFSFIRYVNTTDLFCRADTREQLPKFMW